MVRYRQEILDFVVVVLVFGQKPGEGDDEVLGQLVPVVVDRLLLFGRENLACRTAAHGRFPGRCLLHGATPDMNRN